MNHQEACLLEVKRSDSQLLSEWNKRRVESARFSEQARSRVDTFAILVSSRRGEAVRRFYKREEILTRWLDRQREEGEGEKGGGG